MTYAIQYEPNFMSLKSNMSQNKDITLDLSLPDSLKENDLSVQIERMDKETVETDLGMKSKELVEMIKSVEEEPLIDHNKTTASNDELIEPLHLYNGSCNGDKGLSLPDKSKDVLSPRTLVALASDTLMKQLLTSDNTSEHLVSKKENGCLTLESSKINGDKSVKRKLNNKEKVVPSKKIKLDKDGMCLLKDDTQGIKKEVLETNIKSEYKALSSKGVSLDDIKLNLKPVVKLPRCKSLSCGFCWRSFLRLPDLNAHLVLHEQYPTDFLDHMLSVRVKLRKMFSCSKCGENFSNQREYKLHQIKHVGDETVRSYGNKSYKYEHSEISFSYEDSHGGFPLQNTVNHSALLQSFPYVCHCGIGYYKVDDLKIHLKKANPRYHRQKEITKFCPKIKKEIASSSKSRLSSYDSSKTKAVAKTDRTNPQYQPLKRVITQAQLLVNANINRDKNGMFKCFGCEKKFKTKQTLITHGVIHTGEKPFECDICSKRFTQIGALKLHKVRHAGVRSYSCSFCKKEFTEKSKVEIHIRTHTGEKPYECQFCYKAFGDPCAYRRHERIHTGEKPYSCQWCTKRFGDSGAASRHRAIHSKQAYSCEICFKTFKAKFYCQRHMKTHFKKRKKPCKFECNDCGEKFIRRNCIEFHILEKHFMVHLYCSRCHRKFYTEHDLKQHKNKKCIPIICKICHNIYPDKKTLKKHSYKHKNPPL